MSDIYVFSSDESSNDYDSMGIVGALIPSKCEFKEQANGESSVSLTHPLDEFGRYLALENGNILVVPVPVRTTPEIQNGSVVTTVWSYKVKDWHLLTHKSQMTLYKKATGNKKYRVLNSGESVTVVQRFEDENARWKVKCRYGTGWFNPDGLELVTEHHIANNSESIQEVCSPWTVMPQLFRIYEVKKSLKDLTVTARHISYDLMYNVTSYECSTEVNLQTAIDGVLTNSYATHDFHGYTNVANVQVGLYYNGQNIIKALIDPEEGICAKYEVNLVRDNMDLFFLHDAGMNRGVRIQYGKNMTGIDFTYSEDSIVTRIIPVGEQKNGDELYLGNNLSDRYIDLYRDYIPAHPEIESSVPVYPVPHVHYLTCENCKIGDNDTNGGKITYDKAIARMREQANKMFADECYNPKIQMKVEFINLGDTEEYQQFKNLENCFLFDYVIVQHPKLNVDVTAQIVSITWDCLKDQMSSVEIGSVGESIGNVGITTWQVPSGFNGSKIGSKTVDSRALRQDIIAADHIQSNTINTSHLNSEEITAYVVNAISANFNSLTAGKLTTDELYATLAQIVSAEINDLSVNHADVNELAAAIAEIAEAQIQHADIDTAVITHADVEILTAALSKLINAEIEEADINNALIDWAGIRNLTAQIASVAKGNIGTVHIHESNIDWADILELTAELVDISQARIDHAEISQAKIEEVTSIVLDTITLTAQNANFDFATAQRLVASAMILDQGVGGSITIENLVATSAMFVQATMGTLTLKGSDDKYYDVVIDADGSIHTREVELTPAEIDAGETISGKKIVETEAAIAELNSTNIRTQTLIASEIFTAALEAEKISASEAFMASATIPELYVTAINAIGETLTITANRILMEAGGDVSLSDYTEDLDSDIESINDSLDEVRLSAESAMNSIQSLAVGGVNLINNSLKIELVGTENPATSYLELASGLLPGTVYTFSMSSANLLTGNVAGMTLEAVRLPDTEAGETEETVFFDHILDFSGGHQKYTFVTADDGHTYALRLYAGIKGSSSGVTVEVDKAKLEEGTFATMWTESLSDTETKLRSLTTRLELTQSGLSTIVNHVTEDVDGTINNVNSYFRFDGSDPNNPKLIIGTTESPMTMELTNSRLSFLWHGDAVAYFSDNKLYVTNVEAIQRLSVGTSNNGYLDIVTTATGVGFLWRS